MRITSQQWVALRFRQIKRRQTPVYEDTMFYLRVTDFFDIKPIESN
jgi:hypothetical protein